MNRLFKDKEPKINAKDQKIFIKEIRRNIKELNHSMQSIEKMIEKSRYLFRESLQPTTYSFEKKKIKISNASSFLSSQKINNPLFHHNHSNERLNNIPNTLNKTSNNLNTENSFNNYSLIDSTKKMKETRLLNHSMEKIKKGLYHFSPQKTKKHNSLSTNSNNRSNWNPEINSKIALKPKHSRFLSDGNANNNNSSTKKIIKLGNPDRNLLIQNKGRKCQCKTQYKDEQQQRCKYKNNQSNIAQKNSKKHISIKLFCKQQSKKKQDQQFKQILIDRGYKVQPPYVLKMKLLQKNQKEGQQTLESKQQKKNRFLQKITQYKFVENYLSKNQIWEIYNKLISENIPQLKWPIVIVDEVYKKIQNTE